MATKAPQVTATADPIAFAPTDRSFRVFVETHIPHGSGDAEYRIIDAASDNGDVLAIIDPNMMMDDPADFAERVAAAINSASDGLTLAAPRDAGHPTVDDWRHAVVNGVTELGWKDWYDQQADADAIAQGVMRRSVDHG